MKGLSTVRAVARPHPCLGMLKSAKARQLDWVLSVEIRSLGRVLALRWEHIDGGWWTIPAEVAKNGLTHCVPSGAAGGLGSRVR